MMDRWKNVRGFERAFYGGKLHHLPFYCQLCSKSKRVHYQREGL